MTVLFSPGPLLMKRAACFLAIWICCLPIQAIGYESFLEPAEKAELVPAARETIDHIHVKEGERVSKGQLLVSFKADILKARRKVAALVAGTHGKIDAAVAVRDMREKQFNDLEDLAKSGNVRPRELDRARADLAVARAEVQALKEEKSIKKAELEQIEALLAEKELRAPLDGIVTRINGQKGELAGGTDKGVVVTLVRPNPLKAVFHLPLNDIGRLSVGQELELYIDPLAVAVRARIQFISPVADPESATIRVVTEVVEGKLLQAGMLCRIEPAVESE